WIYFKPAVLGRGIDLVHKIPKGHVDLQFAGMGTRLSEIRARFKSYLEHGMRIEQAQKSAVVRIQVPKSDLSVPFAEAADAMEEAIRSASRLLSWYARHETAQTST